MFVALSHNPHGYTQTFVDHVREKRLAAKRHREWLDGWQKGKNEGVELFKSRYAPRWVIELALEISEAHSVWLSSIAGQSRVINVVNARNELIYRIKEKKPNLSSPQIAKWFGKDYTSILHALAKHAELAEKPPLTTYDLKKVRARNAAKSKELRWAAA